MKLGKNEAKKIEKDILKTAKTKLVNIGYFAKKYGKHFLTIERMFWKLEKEGKLIPIETTIMVSGSVPLVVYASKALIKRLDHV